MGVAVVCTLQRLEISNWIYIWIGTKSLHFLLPVITLRPRLCASNNEEGKASVKDTHSMQPNAAMAVTTPHSVRQHGILVTHSHQSHCL